MQPDCARSGLTKGARQESEALGKRSPVSAVRQAAIRAGLKLSEYGLFRGDELIASATEDDVYAALVMDWVPPPMREDTGEVEAGIKRQVPALVQEKEIRGDLHTHINVLIGFTLVCLGVAMLGFRRDEGKLYG